MEINSKLLDLLVCPACLDEVEKISSTLLRCKKCKREYEIKEGIPIMLVKD